MGEFAFAIPAPSTPAPRGQTLGEQSDRILALCRDLSAQHRLSFPPDLVRDRLHGLVRQAGELFSDRMLEICFLLQQNEVLRFNELRRLLGVISTRTLAGKLAILHRERLVIRTMKGNSPPHVEYRLSASGHQLVDLLFPALLHVGRLGEA